MSSYQPTAPGSLIDAGPAAAGPLDPDVGRVRRALGGRVARRFLAHRAGVIAGGVLLLLLAVAMLAPLLMPADPNAQNLTAKFHGPSSTYWLGTDGLGRDIFSRVVSATRVTMAASGIALGLAVVLGVPSGLYVGYVGGRIDAVCGVVADALLALPPVILALAVLGSLGTGLTNAMIAVGIALAPRFYRVARIGASEARQEGFVDALKVDGCGTARMLWRHVLPNSVGVLLVQATFSIGLIISAEASLSFLGLGVKLPEASWGGMIQEAFNGIHSNAWPIVPPTIAVVVAIVAAFIVGDTLRDAFGRSGSGGEATGG